MPRIFNRIINFHVKGELYDTGDTTPESILRNYTWTCKNMEGDIHIIGRHKDNRGKITEMIALPKIHLWKQPDTDLFVKL